MEFIIHIFLKVYSKKDKLYLLPEHVIWQMFKNHTTDDDLTTYFTHVQCEKQDRFLLSLKTRIEFLRMNNIEI